MAELSTLLDERRSTNVVAWLEQRGLWTSATKRYRYDRYSGEPTIDHSKLQNRGFPRQLDVRDVCFACKSGIEDRVNERVFGEGEGEGVRDRELGKRLVCDGWRRRENLFCHASLIITNELSSQARILLKIHEDHTIQSRRRAPVRWLDAVLDLQWCGCGRQEDDLNGEEQDQLVQGLSLEASA